MDRPPAVRRIKYWDDSWSRWHLDWGAVWVGALAMLIAAVLFSFIATAVGAQKAVDARAFKWAELPLATIVFSVFGAFLASALGAWVAARMSGARLAEPAIFHGVAAWLVVLTVVITLAPLAGAHSLAGGYLGNMTRPARPRPRARPWIRTPRSRSAIPRSAASLASSSVSWVLSSVRGSPRASVSTASRTTARPTAGTGPVTFTTFIGRPSRKKEENKMFLILAWLLGAPLLLIVLLFLLGIGR